MDASITEIYVGSSININQRIDSHKSDGNNPNSKGYNYKVYRFIRSNGGWSNWTYTILEECDVEDKDELHDYEDLWIVNLNPQLNCIRARRNKADYYQDNKEKLDLYYKEYYEKNKDKESARLKEYREKNKEKIAQWHSEKIQCECGSIVTQTHKARHLRTKKHQAFLNL